MVPWTVITSPTDQSVAAAMCFPQILYMHSLTKMLACLFRPLFNVYVLQSSSIRGNISAINIWNYWFFDPTERRLLISQYCHFKYFPLGVLFCFVFQSDNNELTGISDVQSPQAVPAGGKRKKMGFECGLSSQIAVLQWVKWSTWQTETILSNLQDQKFHNQNFQDHLVNS